MKYIDIKNIFFADNGKEQSFDSGFETHTFYSAICDSVKSKLHVYGRKNRKLFDKDHWDFFKNLPEGFDLKIFFLNPDSVYIHTAHTDPDFKKQLIDCISNARAVLKKFNINQNCIQFYDYERKQAKIVADNLQFYHDIKFINGIPEKLTNSSFSTCQV